MTIYVIIYILIFVIFALVAYAILQIKLFGMKVKDFWTFIEANQMLDKLYQFAKQYENMSPQEQVIYLSRHFRHHHHQYRIETSSSIILHNKHKICYVLKVVCKI